MVLTSIAVGRRLGLVPVLVLSLSSASVRLVADDLRVAVASNFTVAAEALADRFGVVSGHRVVLVSGSTGKLYAQILNGARLDAFLAADSRRPELLERHGLAVAGSRFTYARGRLALWSPRPGYVDAAGSVLDAGGFRHLAIANPRLAPYGRAARETLEGRQLWTTLAGRVVQGENIAQAFQFVASGNAELGFVAYSQVIAAGQVGAVEQSGRAERSLTGSLWLVPRDLYTPIDQQAVLLSDFEPSRQFLSFLAGEEAGALLESYGYERP